MTVVRLPGNFLWLHSPVAASVERMEDVDRLGNVKYVVAPNVLHHLFVGEWVKAYPRAELWGAPGLAKKKKALRFDGTLQDSDEPPWKDEIDQLIFRGSRVLPEVVFFHRSSKTLILTDLIQNHDPSGENWFWRIVKQAVGVLAPNGGVPRDLRLTITDRSEARKSLQRMLDWDFEKVIIGHGICFETDAKDRVRSAFGWLLREQHGGSESSIF